MTQLINSLATSAYQVMTSMKRMDNVQNSTVLASVSRHDLMHTLCSCQLRFLGHLLCSNRALYALYELAHGKSLHERPRTNYINYTQKKTGHQLPELTQLASTCGRVC